MIKNRVGLSRHFSCAILFSHCNVMFSHFSAENCHFCLFLPKRPPKEPAWARREGGLWGRKRQKWQFKAEKWENITLKWENRIKQEKCLDKPTRFFLNRVGNYVIHPKTRDIVLYPWQAGFIAISAKIVMKWKNKPEMNAGTDTRE